MLNTKFFKINTKEMWKYIALVNFWLDKPIGSFIQHVISSSVLCTVNLNRKFLLPEICSAGGESCVLQGEPRNESVAEPSSHLGQ